MRNLALLLLILIPWEMEAQTKIDDAGLRILLAKNSTLVILDVRTAEEFATGHLPEAKLLPFDAIDQASAQKLLSTKSTPVVVYCRSGRRSALAAETLRTLGYTKIWDLGAVTNWKGPLATGR